MASEGVSLCPEAATCLGVLDSAVRDGRVARDGRHVVFNTGATQKYVECMERELPTLDRAAPDWERLAG